MTDQIFFDTDCLSAFLWTAQEYLLIRLYNSKIALPQQVYEELTKVPFLLKKTNQLLANKNVILISLIVSTPAAELYIKLSRNPDPGYKIIGKGEAAAISLTKYNDGILASNNMSDVRQYIELYKLKYVTTGEIMFEALSKNLINERQGNSIWKDMLAKQRQLPANTFSEYLKQRT